MKSLRNKVILSGIVLVFAFIATIGSTYAWFTVSQSVSVETMNLNVSAADNLAIRPYLGTETEQDLRTVSQYSSTVSEQELFEAGYLSDTFDKSTPGAWVALTPWQLQPVSVLDDSYGVPTGKALNYLSEISTRTYAVATANDVAGHYIELKFWVYSQAEGTKSFDVTNVTISAVDQDGVREEIANAVRVSMWMDDSLYGGGAEGSATIFGNDTNYLFDFNDGEAGETIEEEYNIINTTGGDTFVAALSTAVVDADTGFSSTSIFSIQKEQPTLLTILIYVEGWNSFADNDVAESNFDIAFSFGTSDL